MFDIAVIPTAKAASEAGYTFEPRFPDGSMTGIKVTVCGPDSEAARAYATRRFADLQAKEAAARRAGRDAEPPGAAELEEQMIDLAAVYTMAWDGVLENAVPLLCTPDNARRLYRAHPWLRSQVVAEAQNLGNFVRPLSASFSSTPQPSSAST